MLVAKHQLLGVADAAAGGAGFAWNKLSSDLLYLLKLLVISKVNVI